MIYMHSFCIWFISQIYQDRQVTCYRWKSHALDENLFKMILCVIVYHRVIQYILFRYFIMYMEIYFLNIILFFEHSVYFDQIHLTFPISTPLEFPYILLPTSCPLLKKKTESIKHCLCAYGYWATHWSKVIVPETAPLKRIGFPHLPTINCQELLS